MQELNIEEMAALRGGWLFQKNTAQAISQENEAVGSNNQILALSAAGVGPATNYNGGQTNAAQQSA